MNNYIINKQINNNLDYIEDFNIWDIKTIFNYIISKPIEFLLLILVFIIIYVVDYISQINNVLFAIPQSLPLIGQSPQQIQTQEKKKKRNK